MPDRPAGLVPKQGGVLGFGSPAGNELLMYRRSKEVRSDARSDEVLRDSRAWSAGSRRRASSQLTRCGGARLLTRTASRLRLCPGQIEKARPGLVAGAGWSGEGPGRADFHQELCNG